MSSWFKFLLFGYMVIESVGLAPIDFEVREVCFAAGDQFERCFPTVLGHGDSVCKITCGVDGFNP